MKNKQDIVILCSPLLVDWICRTFAEQIADQRLPASIIWSGASCRYGQGIVVIAWQGKVSDHFLEQLEIDTDVVDYALCDVATVKECWPEQTPKAESEPREDC